LAKKNRDETEKPTNREDDQSDFELHASPNGNLQEEVLESEALVLIHCIVLMEGLPP
jgi:hypothetical protein